MRASTGSAARRRAGLAPRGLGALVAALALVEITSGILQGYYTPILTDIARHVGVHDADVNWLEAAQLMVSALSVPILAKMGDLWGHKRILLVSTAITALASWAVAVAPSFATLLVAWGLQGVYAVWLPLEVAIIYLAARRGQSTDAPADTRRAAAVLVFALEAGVIAGALSGGALVDVLPFGVLLALPAVAVTLCLVAIAWLAASLVTLMAGLSLVRLQGVGSVWTWLALVAAFGLLVPFVRHSLRTPEPLIDVRMLAAPAQWPVQLTATLFGVSVLGAQVPLSTFARTDPSAVGYGLGLTAGTVSYIIGAYVLSLAVGALLLPVASRVLSPRGALVAASGSPTTRSK